MFLFDGNNISNQAAYAVQSHTGACFCMSVDPSGKYVATGGADFIVTLLDTLEYAPVQTIKRIDGQINQIRFSRDGNYIASASEKNHISIYETSSGMFNS